MFFKKDYPDFYKPYVKVLDPERDLIFHLESSLEQFESLLYAIDENLQSYRYAPGKWTIKEIVQHLIDAERVFVYRALRFLRKDQTPLKGFDENDYVRNTVISNKNYIELLDEFCLLRRSTILMFRGLEPVENERWGLVENQRFTVKALGEICSGHVLHHLNVINSRYLTNP